MLKFVDFSEAITIMANDGKVYMDSYTYGIIQHLKTQKYVAEFSEELALPETPEVPEKPIEAAETPEVPKKPTKKKVAFDYGKLGALIRAGWSVKKIADDFGVSDQTIYNRIAEMRKKEGKDGQTDNA